MNVNKTMQFLLRWLLTTTMLFAVSAVAQDAHATGQFQGPKANKGHVTHSNTRRQERPHAVGRLRRAGHSRSALASG